MGIHEWIALGGILLTIITGIGIPLTITLVKMWASMQIANNKIADVDGRLTRAEVEKVNVNTSIFNSIGATNDRINEHAEQLADHGARISNNEGEIKNLRREQDSGRNRGQRNQ